MTDHPTTAGFRPVLLPDLGRWLWPRVRVYLAVALAAGVGFFFVAGWLAAPKSGDPDRVVLLSDWVQLLLAASTVLVAYSGWRRTRRHQDDRHLPPQPRS